MKKSMNLAFVISLFLIIFACLGGPILLLADLVSAQRVNVGVVVDYDSWVGKMGLSCINMALSDFYASNHNYSTRLVLHTRDSKSDVVGAAAAALDLLKNVEVQAIIGSITSMQANFVADLCEKALVPIISYSTADPSLRLRSSYFFQATQSESSQVKAISAIVREFGWRKVVPIYADNVYGEGLIPFLTDALVEVDALIPYRSVIPSSATDNQIVAELHKLMTLQTRVFVVHVDVLLGTRIFTKAKEIGMISQGYVWIMTHQMTSFLNSLESSVIDSMQGVLGIKMYVPESKTLREFRARWKHDNPTTTNGTNFELNVFGLWAYDAATALAIAVEKVGVNGNNFTYNKANHNISGSITEIESIGVSLSGPNLRDTLSDTRFNGLAGNFSLGVSGQLESLTYQIINVNGDGQRVVGFWTPKDGLVRNLNSKNTTSSARLGLIIWPGESTSVAKGWGMPGTTEKLRIGVPLNGHFPEFVMWKHEPGTNSTTVTGYCLDIFEAVMKELPYAIDYEFIPFAGTYDELIYQVHLEMFDAVVGDITIKAKRSSFVDFTIAYTEPGVSIIIPLSKMKKNNNDTWIFLKPYTWELWVMSASFFFLISLVVWVLEHPVNEDFQGPPSNQIGNSFWFSLSTMVFAHGEKVVSNLARFVVVVWVFVVLILSQSYAASLSSFLTVQQIQPDNDYVLNELLKKGDTVAFQNCSFVYGMLKDVGFADYQLRSYSSLEEAHELVSKGEVAAIIDEIPYLNLFLAKYCSNYTMVDARLRSDGYGFGFVFQRGSPLSPDFSKALLNVMEGEAVKKIENTLFGKKTSCPDPNSQISSTLSLESFWGLFLVAGISSLSALAIHFAIFFYGQRHIILSSSPPAEASIWERMFLIFRTLCRSYSCPHDSTLERSNQVSERRGSDSNVHGVVDPTVAITSTSTHQQSPLSYCSDHTADRNLDFSEEQDQHPPESANLNQGPAVELTIQN